MEKETYAGDSGNWNDAKGYSKEKIHDVLVSCDHYQRIAYFGSDSILEELMNYNIHVDLLRYNAFVRLLRELVLLIDNTLFAMKAAGTKDQVEKFRKTLQGLLDKRSKLVEIRTNVEEQVDKIYIKNNQTFEKVLDFVSTLKAKINIPLNKNNLIFTDKVEFDPRSFKTNVKRRIIEDG